MNVEIISLETTFKRVFFFGGRTDVFEERVPIISVFSSLHEINTENLISQLHIYSFPSQRPSFEHAGINLIHTAITFHHFKCFILSLKPTFSGNLILHLSLFLGVGL